MSAISAFSALAFFDEKGRQRRRSGLFLALEQRGHLTRRPAELLEGSAGLEKGHELAFVVRRAARHDPVALRPGFQLGLEGRAQPEVQGVDRLHVVVAIEQDMRRVAAAGLDIADNHRPAFGRVLGRLESKRAEFADQPVRRPLAIREMRGNRGNRRDRQESEQPIERRRLIGVDRRKNVVNRSHFRSAPRGAPRRPDLPASLYHKPGSSSSCQGRTRRGQSVIEGGLEDGAAF